MNEALLIVGMLAATFSSRYPILALFSRVPMPKPLFRALRFVPTAVLVAICAPAILKPGGELALDWHNAYLIGSLVAIAVAWKTRNLLATIVLGMGVFLLWRVWVGV